MLLHVDETEERRAPASAQSFCLKSAVIECLNGPFARKADKSLELDALKKILVDKYFNELSGESTEASKINQAKMS